MVFAFKELGFYWKVWNKIQDVTYSRGCRNSHYDLEDFLLLLLVNRCLSISQYINDSATLKEKEHTHTHIYMLSFLGQLIFISFSHNIKAT